MASCKSIMIVEDDADIRDTLKQVLELDGFDVITARNGKEAIDLLRGREGPCLIFLDLMMPVMSGWEFLQVKKANNVLAQIPVVISSASGDAARTAERDADRLLRKPIELNTVLKIAHDFCDKVQQLETPATLRKAA
jgi:CheY-like chemotaxis protein